MTASDTSREASQKSRLFLNVAGAGIGHHGLADARWPVEQQTEALAAASRCRQATRSV